jgi:hypothetical protein
MNPTKGKGERYIHCQHDSECLDLVIKKGWNAFNCGGCEVYLQSETYKQMQVEIIKKGKKENVEMAGQNGIIINPDEKNQLRDLNNALFSQLDRLTDDDLNDEKLQKEILRSKAVSNLAAQIIQNARLALEGAKAIKAGEVDRGTLMIGRGEAVK